MRRVETYVGQQVYEWLFSAQAQNNMTAMAKVCSALFGTAGTVNGLACAPTSPATMTVQIGAGEVYQMENLEATACGTLPADTAHTILKQGIQLGTYTTTALAAPTTSGQSINYLIEAQYQDSDISLDPTTGSSPVVLQFYNSTNPSQPWSGPNNSGSTSNTFRDGIVAYQIKAGVAATTGSQVTPSPDTGWIGLWVVTVPYGATSLTSSNISQYTGSPILPNGILQSIITGNLAYGVDSGTAGVVQAKFPIPVTTLVDGMDVWVKIAAANPSTATFTPNPGVISAAPVVGAAHAALQGNELIANGRANFVYRADITSWVLVECTGGALQVAPATASQHAMQLGQATGRLLRTTVIYNNGSGTLLASINGGAYSSIGTSGSATFSPLAATSGVDVEVCGGGGGSGGTSTTSSTQYCGSGGGTGGSYGRGYYTSGFSGAVLTAGLGGTAGAGGTTGTAGGNGGASSFGSLLTAPGGLGSAAGILITSTANILNGAAASGISASGGYVNAVGGPATPAVGLGGALITGNGGNTPLGMGGVGKAAGAGTAGGGWGAGGGGAGIGSSTTGVAGAAGTAGVIIIREYA